MPDRHSNAESALRESALPPEVAAGKLTLRQYLERKEAGCIREALRFCESDEASATHMLGTTDMDALRYKIMRYGISESTSLIIGAQGNFLYDAFRHLTPLRMTT